MVARKIGLVLSGGGVRGAAHLGILQALEEVGLVPTYLSASSSGAIVGALYAAGYAPKEILSFFTKNAAIFRWYHFSRRKPGILDAESYAAIFEPWLNGHTFETLSKRLFICVTDVLNGQPHYFSSGELVRPILASAAVPGIFTPVEIYQNWYIDGGTMNNFPVEPLCNQCEVLLGNFVSPQRPMQKRELNNTLKLINRASSLGLLAASLPKFTQCDFVFYPDFLCEYGLFDTNKAAEIFERGYQFALEQVPELSRKIGTARLSVA